MLPFVLMTPVVVGVKTLKAATVPTVKPLASRKEMRLPAPLLLAARVPLTLLLATSRVTSPPARTPRLTAVMMPAAFCDRSEERRGGKDAVPGLAAACKI